MGPKAIKEKAYNQKKKIYFKAKKYKTIKKPKKSPKDSHFVGKKHFSKKLLASNFWISEFFFLIDKIIWAVSNYVVKTAERRKHAERDLGEIEKLSLFRSKFFAIF